MSYTLFIDESGDHNLKSIGKNSPIFVLGGCIIKDVDLGFAEVKFRDLKLKYFGTEDVILHYREIRKREGVFICLNDKIVNDSFIADLNQIFSNLDMKCILSVIDKQNHINCYGRCADDPYCLSLNFVIERFIFAIENNVVNAKIYAEKRGNREDQALVREWVKVYQRGTSYISNSELKSKIKEFKLFSKQENILGLQIADIVVSCIARKILKPSLPESTFDVIKSMVHKHKGTCIGTGVKVFPDSTRLIKTISSLI